MRSLIAACVVLGLMAATASAESILDVMSPEAIYADALWGVGGNTVDSITGDHSSWIVDADPPVGDPADLKWDHLTSVWNGGIDQFGAPGGSSIYSNDDPVATPAPVIRTTATGLNSALSYNVYLAYYSVGGVNAALMGESLNTYAGNYTIDTGVNGAGLGGNSSVKLALLGEVSGVTDVAIDVGSTGNSYYEGLLVDIVPPTPPTFLELLGDGGIYADASFGPDGNTVDRDTGDHSSWVQDGPTGAVDDLRWDHNTSDWNGGLTADGETGGTSFYSSDDPAGLTPAPVLTTTATGLDPGLTYDVYLTYYDVPPGVQAALSGDTLETYSDNWDIDSGIMGKEGDSAGTAKLAWLGQVSGVSEVGIDVASTGGSYYDGLAVVAIPEPSTLVLAFSGLLGLLVYGWRRRK